MDATDFDRIAANAKFLSAVLNDGVKCPKHYHC